MALEPFHVEVVWSQTYLAVARTVSSGGGQLEPDNYRFAVPQPPFFEARSDLIRLWPPTPVT